MKRFITVVILILSFFICTELLEAKPYTVGVGDVLQINILRPDQSSTTATVSPGGDISVPFIGSVQVKGRTVSQIQKIIQRRLSQGYLKYPVITVSLTETNSRRFTVSGEVNRPGTYPLTENASVLRAISVAGGFTRFGSSSKVKVLRPRKGKPGYTTIKVNIKKVMDGDSDADILLEPGDIIVVSESFF
ncbi:MAG: polysaccharide export protein [bacterium]|nr:polysaccharide export protein [bacterium]